MLKNNPDQEKALCGELESISGFPSMWFYSHFEVPHQKRATEVLNFEFAFLIHLNVFMLA